MGIEEVLLEFGVGGFPVEGEFAEPEAEGLVVDQEDDLEGDEGKFSGEEEEAGGGEGAAFSGQGTEENLGTGRAGAVVDVDVEVVAGDFQLKIEMEVEGAVGGNVEELRRDPMKGPGRGGSPEQIGFHLTEGVAHLDHGAEGGGGGPVFDKVERHRIENVTEDTRQGNEEHAWVVRKFGGFGLGADPGQNVFFDGGLLKAREGEVIAVAEVVEVPAVVGETAHPGCGGVDFVEVEAEEENVIAELVDLGGETAVHDPALVEAGAGAVGRKHGLLRIRPGGDR